MDFNFYWNQLCKLDPHNEKSMPSLKPELISEKIKAFNKSRRDEPDLGISLLSWGNGGWAKKN
jgi:hypothetical protein